jgi:hypothetical protein
MMPVRRRGEPRQDVLRGVEPGGRLEGAGQGPRIRDAVQPEGPLFADSRVRARDVPAARMGDEPVRMQGAFAAPAADGGVPDRDWPVVARGIGESEENRGIRGGELARRGRRRGERERSEHAVEPAGDPVRKHPPDLGRGRLARRACCCYQSGAVASGQAEQHGERFVVVQHERGHAVPRGESVPAIAAAYRLDGHAEVGQVVHVPPHGALIDAEPARELGHRPGAA